MTEPLKPQSNHAVSPAQQFLAESRMNANDWELIIDVEKSRGRLADIRTYSVNWLDGTHNREIAEKCVQFRAANAGKFFVVRDVIAGAIEILDDEFVASMQTGRD